jgi:hypothetical protein
MFDPLSAKRQAYERYLLDLAEAGELEGWDDPEERYYREEVDDDEPPFARMARLAVDIEAGRAEVPHRWKLERPGPGILLWTTPSGRRCACNLNGELLPLP